MRKHSILSCIFGLALLLVAQVHGSSNPITATVDVLYMDPFLGGVVDNSLSDGVYGSFCSVNAFSGAIFSLSETDVRKYNYQYDEIIFETQFVDWWIALIGRRFSP